MIFGKLIKKIIEKRAGKYSATVSVLKGADPVVSIGAISGIVVALFKIIGIDIDEKTVAEIAAGATSLYGLIKIIINAQKNNRK